MTTPEASSFRDQSSRVYIDGERVLRGFNESSGSTFMAADDSGALRELVERGWLVDYSVLATDAGAVPEPNHVVIASPRLGFVSVPSEWSFSMLRDAALLTLDINLALIDKGFILKDASAFNVTFDGPRPIFLDLGSLDTIGEQGLWAAYGQFVDHFLCPLFLEAYAGVPFQPRLRGTVTGIPVSEANAILRGKARRRKGVLSHVVLRSRLEQNTSGYDAEARTGVAATELPRAAVKATIQKVRNLVAGLSSPVVGTWTDYEASVPYDDEEYQTKLAFVRNASSSVQSGTLIDVGANTGSFSLAAEDGFDSVLALDVDPGAVDRLYQRLSGDTASQVTPLVIDLLNPTPSLGWGNTERSSFLNRARGELGLWLAVLHHLTITGGIPLSHSLDLASKLTSHSVIEFVTPQDAMVELIGASGNPDAAPYDLAVFERELHARFDVLETAEAKPTRRLYFVRSRART